MRREHGPVSGACSRHTDSTDTRPLKAITLRLATADEIRQASGGEVTVDATFDDSGAPVRGGLFCPEIFGADRMGLGHIELAYPVVHPWYEEAVRLITGKDDLSDGESVLDALAKVSNMRTPPAGEGPGEGDPFALRCVHAMAKSGVSPQALVIRTVQVTPPALRPYVRTSAGTAVSADINEHYLRVIARNNALKGLLASAGGKLHGAYATDARDRLATAVKSLIGGAPGEGPLQSLTDLLTREDGLLKRNLAGKRVDYSGRSVIVSGPDLDLRQCGLPRAMAIEQFKPFVAHKLVENGAARGSLEALEMIAAGPNSREVTKALEQVAAEKLVLLNRAPTLSRLGIQPFEPVLVDHHSIMLHPLVCYAFNADFDGDQMAVHVPISGCAQGEARSLLDSAVNLVSPGNGRPIAGPVQDIVLGLWWLTGEAEEGRDEESGDSAEALISAVREGELGIHTPVMLRDGAFSGQDEVSTTAGRVLFNASLPPEVRFVNCQTDKQHLGELVARCLEACGRQRTRLMLDDLNALGLEYVTLFAPSYGLGTAPRAGLVDPIRKEALRKERSLRAELQGGTVSRDAYYDRLAALWTEASLESREAVRSSLAATDRGPTPVYAMIESGARGSSRLYEQTFGISGLLYRPPAQSGGRTVPESGCPSGFWDGLSALEHFAQSYGARKGLVDSTVRTWGGRGILFMMRKLIYAVQDVRITSEDCGTEDSIEVSRIEFSGHAVVSLASRIRGRVATGDVRDSSGNVVVKAGELISKAQAAEVEAAGIERVRIRSALTCAEAKGICAGCYGEDLTRSEMVEIGSAAGVVAAQAISEPATQLTMHTVAAPGTSFMPGQKGHPGGLQAMMDIFEGKMPELTPAQFVEKLRTILGFQGVNVSDKHFEVLARRMYDFIRVDDAGGTLLLAGDVVRREVFESENAQAVAVGNPPAKGSPAVVGAHEAACKSPSVIASAAVGDSVEVLALAALKGEKDELSGTLERIVAGLAPHAE